MYHSIHRVTGVQIDGEYTLEVELSDGTRQKIDFQPIMADEIYGPLLDLSLFDKVKVDPEVHTLVWPNGADFDPAILHDWAAHKKLSVNGRSSGTQFTSSGSLLKRPPQGEP